MKQSDTPRTDACIVSMPYGDFIDRVKLVEVSRQLERENAELLAACEEFVRKVDAGEARSVRSYAQMQAAIKKTKDAA